MTEALRERAVDDGRKIQHHAILYRDDEEFLAALVPILRASVEAEDATFVVTGDRESGLLREELGSDARAVQFMDPTGFYRNTVRAMAAFGALAKALGPRPACVVGAKPGIWSNHADVAEWARYDALVNVAFSNVDFRAFCCFNTATLPPDVIAGVRRTHRRIQEGEVMRENPDYTDPESFIAQMDRRPLPPSPSSAASMPVQPANLHAVRNFVAEQARNSGVTADALHNLLVAVTEVTTNAIRHGTSPVTLRTWPDQGLVCEITDSGHWQPEEFLAWQPPQSAAEPGFGLWGVGMLCDSVQVRTGAKGTAVRLRAGV